MQLHTAITVLINARNATVDEWTPATHPMRPVSSCLGGYRNVHGRKAGVMMV